MEFKCSHCGSNSYTAIQTEHRLTLVCGECGYAEEISGSKNKNINNVDPFKICPSCGKELLVEQHNCYYCGFDNRIDLSTPKSQTTQPASKASNIPKCPKCGSTAITAGQRGFKLTTGFIGSNKTVNRCANCGHTWKPGK